MPTLRTLNKVLKDAGKSDNTEVTRYKGEYWLLHICKNGSPVPFFHSKDISEIENEIKIRILPD